jgi:Ran GTPase-activating protein (RanGAP) involved in mRNA processing and transport
MTYLTEDTTAAFADMLTVNRSLTELHLSHNALGDLTPLANALHTNTTLKVLKVSNLYSSASVEAWAKTLRVNTTLCELDLSSNTLVDKSFYNLLVASLQFNIGLKKLTMDAWTINATLLASSLCYNTTLEQLDFRAGFSNCICSERVLQDMLSVNMTLKVIRCQHINEFTSLMERNAKRRQTEGWSRCTRSIFPRHAMLFFYTILLAAQRFPLILPTELWTEEIFPHFVYNTLLGVESCA